MQLKVAGTNAFRLAAICDLIGALKIEKPREVKEGTS